MEKNKQQEIKEAVKWTFKNEYPNTSEKFKEDLECFLCFCVDETIKEIENRNLRNNKGTRNT